MSEKIAAFFDLDGTLVPEPSLERRFFSALRERDAIPYSNYLRWLVEALRLLPRGVLAAQHANKRYLTGLNADLALEHLDSVTFFEEGIAQVAWHARQSHEIVVITGTLGPLARLVAGALECELEARGVAVRVHVIATELAEARGYWTGRLAGEALYGAAKARAIASCAQKRQWNLRQCHGYGNSALDCDFLCTVGHGHAVNPGRDLAAMANQQDWPIWHWQQGRRLAPRAGSNCVPEIDSLEGQA